MSRSIPSEFEAPGALAALALDANCGPVSAWQVLHYFGRDVAPETIIDRCRFDPVVGTYAIGVAVALAECGLRVEFSTDHDPDPAPVERALYERAAVLGVVVSRGLRLTELAPRLDGSAVAIILYREEPAEPHGHFSPLVAVGVSDVDLPNADRLYTITDLEARRESPGLFRQCIIASEPDVTDSTGP